MENDPRVEDFRRRSVIAICAAGSDRSEYISEELNARGYFATHAGVMKNHNYVTAEDLTGVARIVFSSIHEKKIFDRDTKLKIFVNRNNIQISVLNITESDKDRAHDSGRVDQLKTQISSQLDCIGLVNLNK